MKKYVKKAMEQVAEKKQQTFEVIEKENPEEQQTKKKVLSEPMATYWICVKGHVFKHKYRVHPDRLKQMRCTICDGKIKNKTTESTYLYYLNNHGRGDVGVYRQNKVRKDRQRGLKAVKTKQEPNNNA